jgi:uncharacterized protein YecT (DUF1311 family)
MGRAAIGMAQAAAMAAVVALGVAALSLFPHPRQAPPAPAAPPPVRVAAAAAVAAPAPVASPVPAAAGPVAVEPSLRPRIAPPPVRRRLPAVVQPQTPARTAARAPIVVVAARRPPLSCRAPSVAADRLVCSEPALATLDRRMRAAYARAIAAGADRLEIDRGQARWHGARDRATQVGQLAQLYLRRIADLEAAAQRPPRRRAPSGGQA